MPDDRAGMNRRAFLRLNGTAVMAGLTTLTLRRIQPAAANQHDKWTEWGWPIPYEQVSRKSLDWLQSKGWLPLTIGHFADLPGYALLYAPMRELDLLGKRGLPAKFISFLGGPPIVEAFIAGQTQATGYADFPFWTAVDRGNPARAYALTAVNYEVSLLVRRDSPLQSIRDLKGRSSPAVIGLILGSVTEFYLAAAMDANGIEFGKDYKFAGMTHQDLQYLPKGIDAGAFVDPYVTICVQRGIGRKIDQVFPYYFNTGYEFVRTEIHEHAPDVVQALADALLEATLFARYNVEKAVDMYHADPRAATTYPRELFLEQARKYVTFLKPTWKYLHADFWAQQDVVLARSQFRKGRMKREWTEDGLKQAFIPDYMGRSLEKVGFKVPEKPVFLPKDWAGIVGKPPYPPYLNISTMERPQEFPEPGELTKTWYFKGRTYGMG